MKILYEIHIDGYSVKYKDTEVSIKYTDLLNAQLAIYSFAHKNGFDVKFDKEHYNEHYVLIKNKKQLDVWLVTEFNENFDVTDVDDWDYKVKMGF